MKWLSSISESLSSFPIGWVDLITVAVLVVGIIRGRKRGISEEMLDTVQWLLIIVVGGLFYQQVADFMGQKPVLSLASYAVLSYLTIALVAKIVFTFIKKRLGQKLIEGDLFGPTEYYGGMAAGAVRWLCIYLFALSILHAPHYSDEELAQHKKDVEYNYGSDFFPSVNKIQIAVFDNSLTGKGAEKYLSQLLLAPTSADSRNLRNDNSMAKRNERTIDAIVGGK